MYPTVHVVGHPLVQHKLTLMRRKETPTAEFRRLLREISMLLAYEVTRDTRLTTARIETPGRRWELSGLGVDDESAGYHQRHTSWFWSAGVGTATDGRALAWNLVEGVNDPAERSERALCWPPAMWKWSWKPFR